MPAGFAAAGLAFAGTAFPALGAFSSAGITGRELNIGIRGIIDGMKDKTALSSILSETASAEYYGVCGDDILPGNKPDTTNEGVIE